MGYSEKGNYEKIYQQLIEEKEKIIHKKSNIIPFKSTIEFKGDEYDFAQTEMLEDIESKLNERDIKLLNKINKALDKFLDNDYGICSDCGDVIPFKRLTTEPTADFCVECQQHEEKTDLYYEKIVSAKFKRASGY